MALGLLVVLWCFVSGEPVTGSQPIRIGGFVAFGIAVLELAQCWLPGRVPSVTDVLIAWVATAVGAVLGSVVYDTVRKHYSQVRGQRLRDAALFNIELGPPQVASPALPRPEQHPKQTSPR